VLINIRSKYNIKITTFLLIFIRTSITTILVIVPLLLNLTNLKNSIKELSLANIRNRDRKINLLSVKVTKNENTLPCSAIEELGTSRKV
jgi:bifunctional DNA-binding transcriptional regulator/antitoxin component of YhaV-PrlF toxin-antitoxin module